MESSAEMVSTAPFYAHHYRQTGLRSFANPWSNTLLKIISLSSIQAVDKEVKATQPSSIMLLKIKDEPMDEEWKKAPHSPMGNIKDDEVLFSRRY